MHMKKCLNWATVLIVFALLATFLPVSACTVKDDLSKDQTETTIQTETPPVQTTTQETTDEDFPEGEPAMQYDYSFGTGPEKILFWSFSEDEFKMVGQYIKQNPEFGKKYTVSGVIISDSDSKYDEALGNALVAGGDLAPDIYVVKEPYITQYAQGEFAKFASTYKDLGIDVDTRIKEAEIAPYSVEAGTYNGEVVALSYLSTACVMIYNSDIAKNVFGTDDPAEIEKIVGAGSGDWDKFMKAAAKLKEKGYAAVSGPSDLWNGCEKSADTPWIVDGEINIDPKREKYLDLSKTITEKGYSNSTRIWTQEWYEDMWGGGSKKVFAFFGPTWLINGLMTARSGDLYGKWRACTPPVCSYWNGTWLFANKDTKHKEGVAELLEWITLDTSETGLQYLYANGLIDWDNDPSTVTKKEAVASSVVMAKSNGSSDFCGGQNIFPAIIESNKNASAKAISEYDEYCCHALMNASLRYSFGKIKRAEAIEEFKKEVEDYLSL